MPIGRSPSSSRRSAKTVVTTHWARRAGSWQCAAGANRGGRGNRKVGLHGVRPRAARLCRQERLQRRRSGLVGRHRFSTVRRHGGRCARSRTRALRDAALSVYLAGIARRCGADRERARREVRHRADRTRSPWPGAGARAAVRKPSARRHRREPSGARPRRHPHGDLQQVRPDGGDDRQQVGNVGWLCHALRRHERRIQSDQGSLQDAKSTGWRGCATTGSPRARVARPGPSFRTT